MLALLAPSLALTLSCGGRSLRPQSLPPFLEPYNDRSLELTEEALGDAAVRCRRGVAYGAEPHQTLDVWAPASLKIRLCPSYSASTAAAGSLGIRSGPAFRRGKSAPKPLKPST